jgi:hypothetical protein
MNRRALVSEKDRRHFRFIAETEAELNRESIQACARRDPGKNVEIGLALSELAASFGADLSRPDEVSLIALWKARGKTGEPCA